jgi:hypothetical protein
LLRLPLGELGMIQGRRHQHLHAAEPARWGDSRRGELAG